MEKRKSEWKPKIIIYGVVALIFFIAFLIITPSFPNNENYVEYNCDAKIRLSTTINVTKDGQEYAQISGNLFAIVEDPLTMSKDGTIVAKAGDSYRFITQDAHSISVGNTVTDMVGNISWFGESYKIYNNEGEQIGNIQFNMTNTEGCMEDMDGNLMAFYGSYLWFKDYTVRIYEGCPLDDDTILMIMASYYSDNSHDNKN